jgi:hypothetical protein
MGQKAWVSQFIRQIGQANSDLPDNRVGRHNQLYQISDAIRSAFAVFFMQSPSFLAHQRDMKRKRGRSNMESIFQVGKIPSDNHTRSLLDPTPPAAYEVGYAWLWKNLEKANALAKFRVFGNRTLVGLDGIQFFSSSKIQCPNCSTQQIGETTHYQHRALTALVVHPEQTDVLPFIPEFIQPQDGADKQDSEIAAAKRWLARHIAWLQTQRAILLGDDLFSHQPFCELILAAELDFILVCKPDSHVTLYDWITGMERGGKLATVTRRVWNGRHGEIWQYRYALDVPLRAGDDGLRVNWCDLTITHEQTGERLYHNSFITSLPLDDSKVKTVAHAGRSRWKHENEGHNVLSTRGYHIKHNFGHGEENLAAVFFSLNLLAFFLHTFLALVDTTYQKIRAELGARRTFFDDIRALMRYDIFASWEALLHFMAIRLELIPPPD